MYIENRSSNNIQKTSAQSYKTQIKILPFPGLALSGSGQPQSGATLLGWPKSIYYHLNIEWLSIECRKQSGSYLVLVLHVPRFEIG